MTTEHDEKTVSVSLTLAQLFATKAALGHSDRYYTRRLMHGKFDPKVEVEGAHTRSAIEEFDRVLNLVLGGKSSSN